MDIKAWLFRQGVIFEDLIKGGFVVAAEKNIVMRDLRILLVHAPIEHDG